MHVARRRFGDGSGSGRDPLPASSVLVGELLARVYTLVDLGALVSLSRSRDGGSHAIQVTVDGEWERWWYREPAEAILWLDEVIGLVEDEARNAPRPSAVQDRKRPRSTGRGRTGRETVD